MDAFVAQLVSLCRSRPTAAKWVFVPSHAVGHTLGERLVIEGTNWANLRFTPPFDLALQMAGPFLVERGINPSPEGVGPALVMRLLTELPSSIPTYFRHLADQPKMAETLWAAISDIRMAGLSAVDLPGEAFSSTAKDAELRALLKSYEAYLVEHQLADRASVYREALEHLDVGPVLPGDQWIELPLVIWAPLERRLLDNLPGTRVTPVALDLPGLVPPRRAAILSAPVKLTKTEAASDAERLAFLTRPGEAPPSRADGTLEMFRAGGKEAEVEEVLRRIQAQGLPLDQVEVACAAPDYAALLWEKAQRHGLPVTVAAGVPITFTHPARGLLTFCEWAEGGYPAVGLRRMLQSGDLRVAIEDGPTAGQASRLLARSEATWGRETYPVALAGVAESYRKRAADVETEEEERARCLQRAGQAERLSAWIGGLLALLPQETGQSAMAFDFWLDAASRFVELFAAKASEMDGAAVAVLTDALGEFRTIGDIPRSMREALGLIRGRLEGLTVGGDRARPGHLYVTSLTLLGYAGRRHTFVVGLEEGGVLPALLEDPVLLDSERERISPLLRTSDDRVREALYQVVSRLGSLTGRVCLSFSCRDLREGRETFPSWILLQALRVLKPRSDNQWTYDELNAELGEPVSAVPCDAGQALSDADWWLANLRGLGSAGRPPVTAAFPSLVEGERAEAARESADFTEYDGWVPEAGPHLDSRVSGSTVSPTSLEKFSECPFRYFLQRGLGVEPIEDAEPDPDQWLDALARGSLLHECYAEIMREIKTAGERADPARHGARLRQLGEEKLAGYRALAPPLSEGVFVHESREFLADLDLFLRFESQEADRVPAGFEVGFGAGDGEGEPLARPEPLIIDLGGGLQFRLRGRVDRIDRLLDGTYEVVDYKTGRLRLPGGTDALFAGGRQLQHALYALAAAHLLRATDPGARVSRSSYYFPTRRGRAERLVRPGENPETPNVLRDLFDVLASGTFVHTADKDDCRYCEFWRACGRNPVERAEAKLDHAPNVVLDPYRRLQAHD
jgi:RecB family exonuclease